MKRILMILLLSSVAVCANGEWQFLPTAADMVRQRLVTDPFRFQVKEWARCDLETDKPAGCAEIDTRLMLTTVSFTSKYCVVDPAVVAENSAAAQAHLTKQNISCIATVQDVVQETKLQAKSCFDIERADDFLSCMKKRK